MSRPESVGDGILVSQARPTDGEPAPRWSLTGDVGPWVTRRRRIDHGHVDSAQLRSGSVAAQRRTGSGVHVLRKIVSLVSPPGTRKVITQGLADLPRLWVQGFVHPVAAMRSLPDTGGPYVGLAAVLTRFVVQDLVATLPLALLGRRPFMPAKVPIRSEHHYRAQLVFLPLFGLGEWLLMGGAAHASLRLTGHPSDARRVLDVIGVGMLIPMPPLWLGDAALIAADRFGMPALGFINVPVQLWETTLFGIGLHEALGASWRRAALAGSVASTVYVLGASRLVR